jgi:bifunctional DNase/RNase
MKCSYCPEPAVMQLTEMLSHIDFTDRLMCLNCGARRYAQVISEIAGWVVREPADRREGSSRFLITFLLLTEASEHQVVVLQEAGGQRTLPMGIGLAEAANLDRRLRRVYCPRPLTHDAWAQTITALNAELEEVTFTDLRDGVFFGRLRLSVANPVVAPPATAIQQAGGAVSLPAGGSPTLEIDVRPSDALAMALVENVPVYIREEVLQIQATQDQAQRQGTLAAALPGDRPSVAPPQFGQPPLPESPLGLREGIVPVRPWWKFWK